MGEAFVEERSDDPAVEDVLPALEFPGRDELGPAAAGFRVLEPEAQAVGIAASAGEAEMIVNDVHGRRMIAAVAR
jgi:hypothetical protein